MPTLLIPPPRLLLPIANHSQVTSMRNFLTTESPTPLATVQAYLPISVGSTLEMARSMPSIFFLPPGRRPPWGEVNVRSVASGSPEAGFLEGGKNYFPNSGPTWEICANTVYFSSRSKPPYTKSRSDSFYPLISIHSISLNIRRRQITAPFRQDGQEPCPFLYAHTFNIALAHASIRGITAAMARREGGCSLQIAGMSPERICWWFASYQWCLVACAHTVPPAGQHRGTNHQICDARWHP